MPLSQADPACFKLVQGRSGVQQKNRVLKSVNNEDESRCVDMFLRGDNTLGFEEYRRDFEDGRGWFPVGFYGDLVFGSESEALGEAVVKVKWLKESLEKKQSHKA